MEEPFDAGHFRLPSVNNPERSQLIWQYFENRHVNSRSVRAYKIWMEFGAVSCVCPFSIICGDRTTIATAYVIIRPSIIHPPLPSVRGVVESIWRIFICVRQREKKHNPYYRWINHSRRRLALFVVAPPIQEDWKGAAGGETLTFAFISNRK